MIGTVITRGVVGMLQPSANDEQMECEGTEVTAVQVKAYSRPLVSPDACFWCDEPGWTG